MNTVKTIRSVRSAAAVALGLLVAPLLAACGDDAQADPTTIAETAEQYGTRVDAQCPGGDPGFDAFLAAHPVPTAADWAEFLPAPLKMVSEVRDCIVASNPPAAIADDIAAVVAAFDVVIDDSNKALAAAQSGDLESTEQWIRSVHAGDLIIGRQLARRMGALLSEQSTTTTPVLFPDLTERERDVLDQIARGLDNTSIGRLLFISEKTVRNYVSNIFSKLHVTTRSEAIVVAREAGLGA